MLASDQLSRLPFADGANSNDFLLFSRKVDGGKYDITVIHEIKQDKVRDLHGNISVGDLR